MLVAAAISAEVDSVAMAALAGLALAATSEALMPSVVRAPADSPAARLHPDITGGILHSADSAAIIPAWVSAFVLIRTDITAGADIAVTAATTATRI